MILKPFRVPEFIEGLLLRAPRLQGLEEVITLVINQDECGEVFHLNLPDSLHTQLRILDALDALDARL